jgi:hypothetical protein
MKKALKIIGALVVLLVVVSAVVGHSSPSTSTPAAQPAAAKSDPAPAAQPAAAKTDPAPAAQPAKTEPAKPEPPKLAHVGDSATNGNWQITLNKVETSDVLGQTKYTEGKTAQGKFVVATMTAKNLDKKTSDLNSWDFQMVDPDGVKYRVSSEGNSALIFDQSKAPKALSMETVQPGLSDQFRVVFDVNPDTSTYTLQAAGTNFEVPLAA